MSAPCIAQARQGLRRPWLNGGPLVALLRGQGLRHIQQSAEKEEVSLRRQKPVEPDRQVSFTGWTSIIKTKSLGKASSILVLRDTETKRTGRKPNNGSAVLEAMPLKDVKIQELMDSIEEQKKAPGQGEVNQSIDSHRPARSTDSIDGPIILSQREYDRIFKELQNSYNQLQLSRYITIHEGQRALQDGNAATTTPQVENLQKSVHELGWQAIDEDGNVVKDAAKTSKFRGKKSLVYALMSRVWSIEPFAIANLLGRMDVQMKKAQISLIMAGGSSSILSEIGAAHAVKIEVIQAQSKVRIISSKRQCWKVYEAINNRVRSTFEKSFDLSHLQIGKSIQLNWDYAEVLARRAGCTIALSTSDPNKIFMGAQTIQQIKSFERALAAGVLPPAKSDRKLIIHEKPEAQNTLWTYPELSDSLLSNSGERSIGRFTSPAQIASTRTSRDSHPAVSNVHPLEDTLIHSIRSHLDLVEARVASVFHVSETSADTKGESNSLMEHETWSQQLHTEYIADFGHIEHACKSTGIEIASATELLARNVEQPINLKHESPGIAQLLYAGLRDEPGKTRNILSVHLAPSPSSESKQTAIIPHLRIQMTIDRESRHLELNQVLLCVDNREVDVMCPSSITDLRFLRSDTLALQRPDKVFTIKKFISDIEASAAGYGRIDPPSYLSLNIPPWTLAASSLDVPDTAKKEVAVKYCTTRLEYAQEAVFAYKGYDLIYSRGGAGLEGKFERISLRMDASTEERASQSTSDEEVMASMDYKQTFFVRTSNVLETLDAYAGNMNMMDTSKSSSTVVRETLS